MPFVQGEMMKYCKTIILKDGRECVLRHGTEEDAEAVLANFILTHEQTDFLACYPDEISYTAEDEAKLLRTKEASRRDVEILAVVDGKVAGLAGIDSVGRREKIKHRASFGISIDKAFWGLGIGRAMTLACIDCAKKMGYLQLELDVVEDNTAAVELYRDLGFEEYGRNPMGFCSRFSGMNGLILMCLDLRTYKV